MRKTIQIENLGYSMDDRDLARLFAPHGAVYSAAVSTHANSGQSMGVGFVEMESAEQGESAIAALNGRAHCGRILVLSWSGHSPPPTAIQAARVGPRKVANETALRNKEPRRQPLPWEYPE